MCINYSLRIYVVNAIRKTIPLEKNFEVVQIEVF